MTPEQCITLAARKKVAEAVAAARADPDLLADLHARKGALVNVIEKRGAAACAISVAQLALVNLILAEVA